MKKLTATEIVTASGAGANLNEALDYGMLDAATRTEYLLLKSQMSRILENSTEFDNDEMIEASMNFLRDLVKRTLEG